MSNNSFILTKWYVNFYPSEALGLILKRFILTKWYVNLFRRP